MKIILKFLLVLYVALPSAINALEVGKWSFEKADEYCYIVSLAVESDLPQDKIRGEYYILVYKNIGNPETVVQIEAGYDYKTEQTIVVTIDKAEYPFFTTSDLPGFAWTKDDIKVIIQHYEDLEQYECCQGILDAYNDYRKTRK